MNEREKKFWSRVDRSNPNGCWLWLGRKWPFGHGVWVVDGIRHTASRVAWFYTHGCFPPKNIFVCHKCDVPACCNPNHLFLGTAKDNHDDAEHKGRIHYPSGADHPLTKRPWLMPRGDACPASKLTDAQCVEILTRRRNGERPYQIAGDFPAVRYEAVWKICRGVNRKHLHAVPDLEAE